jgi:hypothetical protein
MEVIEESQPRGIVVVNAQASVLYKSNNHLAFDEHRGYYPQKLAGRNVPVFLSGMLTGQRALDRFSFERLRWHIAKSLRTPS